MKYFNLRLPKSLRETAINETKQEDNEKQYIQVILINPP